MPFIRNPIVYVPDLTNGRPIVDGRVYILKAGTIAPMHDSLIDNADKVVITYQNEVGNYVEQAQPLYTSKGGCLYGDYPESARQFISADNAFVFAVYNRIGQLEYSSETFASDFVESAELAAADSTQLVGGVEARKVGARSSAFFLLSDYQSLVVGSDWTAALQAAIDAANALHVGGSYGGNSVDVVIPAGIFEYTGVTIKKGVSLIGQGMESTILKLMGSTSTGIKCDAATTQSFANQVSYGRFLDIRFISGESAPSSQTIWNATGFSRWTVERCWFEWFGGCTAISVLGATLAGSGGAAQWYNSFYDCFFYRPASRPSAGTALDLGDTDTAKEQVTTWRFFGGHISGAGSGSGVKLRGTGCTFIGMTFEALTTAVTVGSTGTRGATGNSFVGCYWEGNTTNRLVESNAVNTYFAKSFVTGGSTSDNSASTCYDEAGNFKQYLPNSTANRFDIEVANGTVRPPRIKGSTAPSLSLENSAGTALLIANLASSSSSNTYFRFLTTGGATSLVEGGTATFRPADDNVKTLGGASNRWSTVYAGTGTINTSDAREKQQVSELTDAEKRVAAKLKSAIRTFKFNDAVEAKGEGARIHVGVMAQEVVSIFASEGLDATRYALLCYDEYDITKETINEDGGIDIEVIGKGDRYGVRYEQLLAFIISAI